jgi:hypothetical protein
LRHYCARGEGRLYARAPTWRQFRVWLTVDIFCRDLVIGTELCDCASP